MEITDALQQVLKRALVNDGLARGIRSCIKALDKKQAHFCVLAESCDEQEYVKLIEALCTEHGIKLLKVADGKTLGEWAGLCKIDKDGNARNVVGCSSVVVTDYGEDSAAMNTLQEYFATH